MNSKIALRGFSLVEVTLAIGIVSVSMLAILGLLPVALDSVKKSTTQVGMANIAQQLRSELVQMPFTNITGLNGKSYVYNVSGGKLEGASADVYFNATISVDDPVMPGATTTYGSSAKKVKVTVRFPENVPPAGRQTNVFTILTAKQTSS